MKEIIFLKEDQKEKLKSLQNELVELGRKTRKIKREIETIVNQNTVSIKISPKSNQFIKRDIELVYSFLSKNGPSVTKDICEYLNKELETEYKRWNPDNLKIKLDASSFHGYIAKYINSDRRFTKNEKYWEIKQI